MADSGFEWFSNECVATRRKNSCALSVLSGASDYWRSVEPSRFFLIQLAARELALGFLLS
jgi:hypothetical protein